MSDSLRKRSLSALRWSFLQEASQRGLQFLIGVILARLLGPEEFGAIAMLTVFIAVAQVLFDGGFGAALIQRPTTSVLDESSVFFLNLIAAILLASLLAVCAPFIAQFYHQPILSAILPWMALTLVINALASVQAALMVRRLEFRKQAIVSVVATAVSGIAGVSLAWRGFGVWSLVCQQIVAASVRTILLWRMNQWRPVWRFSSASLLGMYRFGSHMAGAVLLNTIFENLNSLLIGRLFAATELGYFNRAQSLQNTATRSLGTVTNRVTFPVFSRMQNAPERLRNGLRQATVCLSFVHFPIMVGLAACSGSLVPLLLTDKWLPCVPYVQVLCMGGLLYPMHILNLNVLTALGHSHLLFRLEVAKRFLFILSILLTYRWGVIPMLWGQVIQGLLAYMLNAHYTKKLAGYSVTQQFYDFSPYLLLAFLMGAVVFLSGEILRFDHLGQFVGQVSIGIAFYVLISWTMKLKALAAVLDAVRKPRPVAA